MNSNTPSRAYADLNQSTVKILLVGVGGQGTLTAARLLGEAALTAGLHVLVGEVHGMSQRSGIVETTVVIGERQSALIGEGEADIILGFEPLETLRALPRASRHALVIMNTKPILPFTVETGQEKYPDLRDIESCIRQSISTLVVVNAEETARQAGAAIAVNMVLLGVLASTGRLPFSNEILEQTIAQFNPSHAELNLKAFNLGLIHEFVVF